jgi:hypothetical protein
MTDSHPPRATSAHGSAHAPAVTAAGPTGPEARHLVQLLLPLYDNAGTPIDGVRFREVRDELTARYGGLTVYSRAPAVGLWKEEEGGTARDDIVVYEVMVRDLDVQWWGEYRRSLEKRFAQEALVVRAQSLLLL